MRYFNKRLVILLFSFYIPSVVLFAQKKDTIQDKPQKLDEVILVNRNPISEKFSVTKIEKLDIYFNPVSKGDPLNAITILPASTNVSETANPVLRGGSADRSRVYVNGAPVLNPVRNSQNNGLGNFSLLNTEIIDKQYVYASNPPLVYGNSSAGIVEIETNKNLSHNSLLISAALSNVGLMFNKNISKKVFVQAYSNKQFDDLLLDLNKKQLPDLLGFSSIDAGLNMKMNFSKNISFNTFNYFINEKYDAVNYFLNYRGDSKAEQKRYFTINNLDYVKGKSKIRFSSLIDLSSKHYLFGLTDSGLQENLTFLTLSHKYRPIERLTFQYGVDYMDQKHDYKGQAPIYFYANSTNSPSYSYLQNIKFSYAEIYFYSDYKINGNCGVSAGLRKNIYTSNNIKNFSSGQFSGFYNFDKQNRIIFGLGNYNSYSTPNYITHNITLLNSRQASIDYYHEKKKYAFTAAVYYKIDKGDFNTNNLDNFNKISNIGAEASLNYNFSKHFSSGISNTFLDQKGYLNGQKYNTSNNLKYFIKTQFTYNNPKCFTSSIALNTRPGNFYSGISSAIFNNQANDFQPVFSGINNHNYCNYFRMDFTINKVFDIKGNTLISFLSINNIFNNKNQAQIYYNSDYASFDFKNYQLRTIYFGILYRFGI